MMRNDIRMTKKARRRGRAGALMQLGLAACDRMALTAPSELHGERSRPRISSPLRPAAGPRSPPLVAESSGNPVQNRHRGPVHDHAGSPGRRRRSRPGTDLPSRPSLAGDISGIAAVRAILRQQRGEPRVAPGTTASTTNVVNITVGAPRPFGNRRRCARTPRLRPLRGRNRGNRPRPFSPRPGPDAVGYPPTFSTTEGQLSAGSASHR